MARLEATLFGILCLYLGTGTPVHGQVMDEAEIEHAIQLGQSGKSKDLLSKCTAGPGGFGGLSLGSGPTPKGRYEVYLGSNLGKIAALAEEAKDKYMTFTRADVPEDLTQPAVHVWLTPEEPTIRNDRITWTSPLTHLVLKKDESVVQPDEIETTPVVWENVAGTFNGTSGVARFPIEAVRALPEGTIDITLITEAGERKCGVNQGQRRKLGLFGGS